jgi:hypothetical protein
MELGSFLHKLGSTKQGEKHLNEFYINLSNHTHKFMNNRQAYPLHAS